MLEKYSSYKMVYKRKQYENISWRGGEKKDKETEVLEN